MPYDKNCFRTGDRLQRVARRARRHLGRARASLPAEGSGRATGRGRRRRWSRRRGGCTAAPWPAPRPGHAPRDDFPDARPERSSTGSSPAGSTRSGPPTSRSMASSRAAPEHGGGGVIEVISDERCIDCDLCVKVCPTNVFDAVPGDHPVIARQGDCQTCFLCEAYCPVDAMFVAPVIDPLPVGSNLLDERYLVAQACSAGTAATWAGAAGTSRRRRGRCRAASTTRCTANPRPAGCPRRAPIRRSSPTRPAPTRSRRAPASAEPRRGRWPSPNPGRSVRGLTQLLPHRRAEGRHDRAARRAGRAPAALPVAGQGAEVLPLRRHAAARTGAGPGDAHSAQEWVWRRDGTRPCSRRARRARCGARARRSTSTTGPPTCGSRPTSPTPGSSPSCATRSTGPTRTGCHLWSDGLEPVGDFVDACAAEDEPHPAGLGAVLALPRPRPLRRAAATPAPLFPREQVHVLRYRDLVDTPGRPRRDLRLPRCRAGSGGRGAVGEPAAVRATVRASDRPRRRHPGRGRRSARMLRPRSGARAVVAAGAGPPVAGGPRQPLAVEDRRALVGALRRRHRACSASLTGEDFSDWLDDQGRGAFAARRGRQDSFIPAR